MIIGYDNKYIGDIYRLGMMLHDNFDRLYNEESLNNNVNKSFLYIEDDKLLGFIHVQDLIDELDIIDIVIDPSYRSKGYASKLLEYVIDYANNKKIMLEVSENNTSAINLYKKYKFVEINRRKGYYNGIDAIIMEKK